MKKKDPKNSFVLKSKTLTVTPMTDAQIADLRDRENDPELKQAYREMLDGVLKHPQERLWYTCWTIALPDGTAVGDLCFKGPPDAHKTVEIGYGVMSAYENRGYATEAVALVCEWAFGTGLVNYVSAQTDPSNTASRRVLEKNGFVPADESGCVNGSPVSVPEREEGCILWEKSRPDTSCLAVYLCLGMSCGLALGLCFDHMALGTCLGIAVGMASGAWMDHMDRESRKK